MCAACGTFQIYLSDADIISLFLFLRAQYSTNYLRAMYVQRINDVLMLLLSRANDNILVLARAHVQIVLHTKVNHNHVSSLQRSTSEMATITECRCRRWITHLTIKCQSFFSFCLFVSFENILFGGNLIATEVCLTWHKRVKWTLKIPLNATISKESIKRRSSSFASTHTAHTEHTHYDFSVTAEIHHEFVCAESLN